MNFENKINSINLIKIAIVLIVIQVITQYVIILFFLNNYNKFLMQQFFKLFIKLIKNFFYKKINKYLNLCNRVFRHIIIILIELLLNIKRNNIMIKFLFKLLKVYN